MKELGRILWFNLKGCFDFFVGGLRVVLCFVSLFAWFFVGLFS